MGDGVSEILLRDFAGVPPSNVLLEGRYGRMQTKKPDATGCMRCISRMAKNGRLPRAASVEAKDKQRCSFRRPATCWVATAVSNTDATCGNPHKVDAAKVGRDVANSDLVGYRE
jgi:hypothetical protein